MRLTQPCQLYSDRRLASNGNLGHACAQPRMRSGMSLWCFQTLRQCVGARNAPNTTCVPHDQCHALFVGACLMYHNDCRRQSHVHPLASSVSPSWALHGAFMGPSVGKGGRLLRATSNGSSTAKHHTPAHAPHDSMHDAIKLGVL